MLWWGNQGLHWTTGVGWRDWTVFFGVQRTEACLHGFDAARWSLVFPRWRPGIRWLCATQGSPCHPHRREAVQLSSGGLRQEVLGPVWLAVPQEGGALGRAALPVQHRRLWYVVNRGSNRGGPVVGAALGLAVGRVPLQRRLSGNLQFQNDDVRRLARESVTRCWSSSPPPHCVNSRTNRQGIHSSTKSDPAPAAPQQGRLLRRRQLHVPLLRLICNPIRGHGFVRFPRFLRHDAVVSRATKSGCDAWASSDDPAVASVGCEAGRPTSGAVVCGW